MQECCMPPCKFLAGVDLADPEKKNKKKGGTRDVIYWLGDGSAAKNSSSRRKGNWVKACLKFTAAR